MFKNFNANRLSRMQQTGQRVLPGNDDGMLLDMMNARDIAETNDEHF